jgi:flagellar hook-associated protein 1
MSLDSIMTVATGGLANIDRQLAVVSQNVANAGSPGYARETAASQALQAGDMLMGVRTGIVVRSTDPVLQAALLGQGATVAGLQTQQSALAAVDAAQGTPGHGNDLPSLLGNLTDAFTSLSSNPADTSLQQGVVTAARTLASGLNALSNTVQQQRQSAQDGLAQQVADLNQALASIGALSTRITSMQQQGQSAAGLQDQRDQAMQTVAQLAGARFLQQVNGNVLAITPNGLSLPTDGSANFEVAGGALSPGIAAPAITLGGADVTARLPGGQIGAALSLRDTVLPTFQGQLDEFSHDLATRFSAAGLSLFTDGSQPVAAAGAPPSVQTPYLGLAGRIAVNPAITASPTLVRDGTGGAPTGQAGYGGLISLVLTSVLGSTATPGAPPAASIGLGLAGNLSAGYATPPDLAGLARLMVAAQSGAAGSAQTQLSAAQAVQTQLSQAVNAVSGVSIDTEMSNMVALQNAYAANARIISAIQSMWTQLLGTSGTSVA